MEQTRGDRAHEREELRLALPLCDVTKLKTPASQVAAGAFRHVGRIVWAFHKRLITAGKAKKVTVIAVARKLLVMLNAIVRDGCPWKGTVAAAS